MFIASSSRANKGCQIKSEADAKQRWLFAVWAAKLVNSWPQDGIDAMLGESLNWKPLETGKVSNAKEAPFMLIQFFAL